MLSVYDGWWCPDITGEMVEVLAVVRLGLFSLIVVVVAGFRETGGLEVVGVEISCSAELSVLRESSSLLLLNTAAAATSHVGIFHFGIAAGCCMTGAVVGVLVGRTGAANKFCISLRVCIRLH